MDLRSFTLLQASLDRVQSKTLLDEAMTIRAAYHADAKGFKEVVSGLQKRAGAVPTEGPKKKQMSDKDRLKRDLAAGFLAPRRR